MVLPSWLIERSKCAQQVIESRSYLQGKYNVNSFGRLFPAAATCLVGCLARSRFKRCYCCCQLVSSGFSVVSQPVEAVELTTKSYNLEDNFKKKGPVLTAEIIHWPMASCANLDHDSSTITHFLALSFHQELKQLQPLWWKEHMTICLPRTSFQIQIDSDECKALVGRYSVIRSDRYLEVEPSRDRKVSRIKLILIPFWHLSD